jgi:hypothetical protein
MKLSDLPISFQAAFIIRSILTIMGNWQTRELGLAIRSFIEARGETFHMERKVHVKHEGGIVETRVVCVIGISRISDDAGWEVACDWKSWGPCNVAETRIFANEVQAMTFAMDRLRTEIPLLATASFGEELTKHVHDLYPIIL